jgi:hypothetical protein
MTALGDFSSGDVLTAADLNAIATTSTTYTPTWTSSGAAPTLGNSTLTGRYIKINKLVWVQILFIRGSTATNGTGAYRWSLPSGIPARSGIYNYMTQGLARLYDASTGAVPIGSASFFGGSTTAISAYANNGVVGNANPFTWATNDEIVMTFTYEAA